MDRIESYRKQIQHLLEQYAQRGMSSGDVESQLIFDTERDHYQLVNVGWHNKRRIYGCVLHIDIKDGKVWIQYNGLEYQVGEDLAALGIPKTDIVLGFQSPAKRPYTDFAVG